MGGAHRRGIIGDSAASDLPIGGFGVCCKRIHTNTEKL